MIQNWCSIAKISGKMSAIVNIKNIEESKQNIHFIPAEIQYDGQANASSYFETSIREDDENKKTASLRGRPLHGVNWEVPSGYTGLVIKETRKRCTEDEDRDLTATDSFKAFTYWNLDKKPSKDDRLEQALQWMDIAKALHGPMSADSEGQGSLKSEVSM